MLCLFLLGFLIIGSIAVLFKWNELLFKLKHGFLSPLFIITQKPNFYDVERGGNDWTIYKPLLPERIFPISNGIYLGFFEI